LFKNKRTDDPYNGKRPRITIKTYSGIINEKDISGELIEEHEEFKQDPTITINFTENHK
jgi:hypothetical protein